MPAHKVFRDIEAHNIGGLSLYQEPSPVPTSTGDATDVLLNHELLPLQTGMEYLEKMQDDPDWHYAGNERTNSHQVSKAVERQHDDSWSNNERDRENPNELLLLNPIGERGQGQDSGTPALQLPALRIPAL